MSKLDDALDAVARGLHVFPVLNGDKAPAVNGGFKAASADEEQVRAWWEQDPYFNIGVWPGESVLILDVDHKHGTAQGRASVKHLSRDCGPFGPTLTVATPTGGLQMYFRLPAGARLGITNSQFALGPAGYPDIDTRGHNGYGLWAGSTREGKPYRIVNDVPIAAIPTKLFTLLQRLEQEKSGLTRTNEERNGPWSEGGRDDGLYRWACALVNQSPDETEFREMVARKNKTSCKPPLPMKSVRRICTSAYKHFNTWQSLPLTDLGMAERFQMDHGHDLMFHVDIAEWFWYSGQRWVQVSKKGRPSQVVMQRAFLTSESFRKYAVSVEDEAMAKTLDGAAKRYASEKGIQSMVELARTLMGKSVVFDAHKYYLNCHNGTLDLSTGKMHGHLAQDYLTKLTSCEYDPEAEAPRWRQFLREVLPDTGARRFMHRWIGYSLTGDTSEQAMTILAGGGRNGKSKLHETVTHVMGEYAHVSDAEILMAAKSGEGEDRPQPKVMALRGRRMVTTSEPEQSHQFAEAMVKRLTGDTEIHARGLQSNPITFDVTWKIWLAANYVPRIKGSDAGIWRRILLVPFTQTFEGDTEDKHLDGKLRSEAAGILAWAVKGCMRWQEDGLRSDTEALRNAKAEYREEMNPLSEFLAECCMLGKETYVASTKDLYDAYTRWYESSGEGFRPMGKTSFGRTLQSIDGVEGTRFKQGSKAQVRGFSGVALAGK